MGAALAAAGGIAFSAPAAPSVSAPPASDPDAFALSPEGMAGDAMDAAVQHCRRGERQAAFALFDALIDQLDPPPALRRLIVELRATGCPGLAVPATRWLLTASTGHDSNVNQGVTVRSLSLGAPGQAVELPLADGYRPLASAFQQLALEYASTPDPQRAQGEPDGQPDGQPEGLQWALVSRRFAQAPAFDQWQAAVAWSHGWGHAAPGLRARWEASHTVLGGQPYQQAVGITLRQPLWQRASWGLPQLHASAIRLHYVNQPTQDAVMTEQGLTWTTPGRARWSVRAWVALQQDHALGLRPGGDRLGVRAALTAATQLGAWRVQPEWSALGWRSVQRFAPGLIDQHRVHRLHSLALTAARPVPALRLGAAAASPTPELLLEWRRRASRDTVPLYAYRSATWSASVAWRW